MVVGIAKRSNIQPYPVAKRKRQLLERASEPFEKGPHLEREPRMKKFKIKVAQLLVESGSLANGHKKLALWKEISRRLEKEPCKKKILVSNRATFIYPTTSSLP
jgi:hypothetical protein